jgi:peptidoglycan/xylan/chitin deacetylase (PgdA/CDA1 family)
MDNGCLRAFFFEKNCNDEMAVANGTATDITYTAAFRDYTRGTNFRSYAAEFNGTSSKVSIGSAADIDDLVEFTFAAWIYLTDAGGSSAGKIFYKAATSDALWISCSAADGGNVGLSAKVGYDTTNATSTIVGGMGSGKLEQFRWHPVAFTYSESGDRKIHIFIDGTEIPVYTTQVASVGTRTADAADTAYIGNQDDGARAIHGIMTEALLYNRALSANEIKWLAHDFTYLDWGAPLRAHIFPKSAKVDPSKQSHGMLSFEFHDGYESHYLLAKPALEGKGVVGVIGCPTDAAHLGAVGRLSVAQMQDFIADGWEIASHSVDHGWHGDYDEAGLRAQFANSKATLEALGATVNHYIWPGGSPQEWARAICSEYYLSASDSGCWNVPPVPLFGLGGVNIDDPAYLTTYQANIDMAYTSNSYLIFHIHDVDAADVTCLDALIDYAQAKGIPIVTRHGGYQNLVEIPTTGPLYDDYSIRLQETSGAAQQFYQPKTLTAVKYIISFLACNPDGSAVTSANVKAFADTALTNEITTTYYEPLGNGAYLCWGVFTGTAATWNVGVEVPAGGGYIWTEKAPMLGGQPDIFSLEVYNDKLYGGTDASGRLYEWNGTDAWVQKAPYIASETHIYSLKARTDGLYAGTYPNGKLLKWNGVDAWTVKAPKLGSETFIFALEEDDDGNLYAGTGLNGMLYRWNGTDAWVQVAGTFGSETQIRALKWYEGKMYGSTYPHGLLLEWNGVDAWTQVAGQYSAETAVYALEVHRGNLYGGSGPHGFLLAWNGIDTWLQRAPQLSETLIFSLEEHEGELYGGTSSHGMLYRWDGASAWIQKCPQLGETRTYALKSFNGKLYGGMGNVNGKLYEADGPNVVYVSVPTCHIAAPASEGGDFPRSPIPNTTGASITRAADVLTIPAAGNIGTAEGTIDVECVAPCTEGEVSSPSLQLFRYYKDVNNDIAIRTASATDKTGFFVRMGGLSAPSEEAVSGFSRNILSKFRLSLRQANTLDGTNYVILYHNIGTGWSTLCVSATQPSGALDVSGTIYVGEQYDGTRHWDSIIRRIRIYQNAIVGVPSF